MKSVIIIGSGINGLVAANYLIKEGYKVIIIEKKSSTGGACIKDSTEIDGQNIDFAYGATVLGMMQDFVFNDTGLSKKVYGYYPKTPKLVFFKDEKVSTKIFQDHKHLELELKNRWGETGKVNEFREDENKVIDFIQNLYKNALSPSIELAEKELGTELTKLWVTGSAKDLLDHYFTSEKTKLYMGMTVIESGPASIKDSGTAFTIPLMDSGSIYDGYWGFVKIGIWKITEELTKINKELGVKFFLDSTINEVDSDNNKITFDQDNKTVILNYDSLIFATDPITPSSIIKNFNQKIDLETIGTSGKVTAFFKNPVRWVDSNNFSDSFRFIFSVDTLEKFEKASQDAYNNVYDYSPGYIQIYPEGSAQRKMNNIESFDKLIFFTKNLSFDKKSEMAEKYRCDFDTHQKELWKLKEMAKICFDSDDYREGREAFMEKRKPEFKGR